MFRTFVRFARTALFGAATAALLPGAQAQPIAAEQHTLSGPYTHENLSVYLIHGKDKLAGKTYLTLQEALKQNKVRVRETGEVNELTIENVSNDDVYVQSGDIVKGGKQDRVLGVDVIIPRKSGKLPVSAFCVEQGCWQKRGAESAAAFGSSDHAVIGKDIKLV